MYAVRVPYIYMFDIFFSSISMGQNIKFVYKTVVVYFRSRFVYTVHGLTAQKYIPFNRIQLRRR